MLDVLRGLGRLHQLKDKVLELSKTPNISL